MRNKKNLLLTWMIGLLSFMFILNGSAFAASKYLEPVNIPVYNAGDPTHVLITPSNNKWTESVLNNSSYKHFYVTPGVYSNTVLRIKTSGTSGSRRTLSLYTPGNDRHPAAMADNEVASVNFGLFGASYWTIDRMANLDRGTVGSRVLKLYDDGSAYATHNIINRFHGRNAYYGVSIQPFCSFNTIQNSYINGAVHEGRLHGAVGIAIANSRVSGTVTEGVKIINNDIRNYTDNIQIIKSATISAPNLIIDSNNLWHDSEIYTNGNYAGDGYGGTGIYEDQYAIAEQLIDLKSGSDEADKPVLITNNKLWGVRQADPETGDSSSDYSIYGVALITSYDVKNIHIENNIIFDSQYGANTLNLKSGSTFNNNIIYDIGKYNPPDPEDGYPSGRAPYSVRCVLDDDTPYNNNTFIDYFKNDITNSGNAVTIPSGATGLSFDNNLFINTADTSNKNPSGSSINNNWFYNHSSDKLNGTNEQIYSTAGEAKMNNYSFQYERFTANPKTKILYGVITTASSPHYEKAGSSISQDILTTTPTESTPTEETKVGTSWVINPTTKKLVPQQ